VTVVPGPHREIETPTPCWRLVRRSNIEGVARFVVKARQVFVSLGNHAGATFLFPILIFLKRFFTFNTHNMSTFTMHNALAVFASLIFLTSSSTAFHIPQFHLSPTPTPSHHDLSQKCTFTLHHKQTCFASKKTSYIQLNSIRDHANAITIDVAALRPAASHNSYVRISANDAFAVENLLDDRSLVVVGSSEDEDEVVFVNGGEVFGSEGGNGEAWCEEGEWDDECWECGMGSRVS